LVAGASCLTLLMREGLRRALKAPRLRISFAGALQLRPSLSDFALLDSDSAFGAAGGNACMHQVLRKAACPCSGIFFAAALGAGASFVAALRLLAIAASRAGEDSVAAELLVAICCNIPGAAATAPATAAAV